MKRIQIKELKFPPPSPPPQYPIYSIEWLITKSTSIFFMKWRVCFGIVLHLLCASYEKDKSKSIIY